MCYLKVAIVQAKTQSDCNQIAQLASTIWKAHYIPIIGKLQVEYMLHKFQSSEAIMHQIENQMEYFMLKYENNLVGYMAIKPEKHTLFLSKIYVLKDFQGMNIGKAAIHFVEVKARAYKLNSIRLTVNIHNKNAIAAYEKLGFKNTASCVTDIGNGFIMDDYEMKKRL
ncbi:GNAT family N-acetyltransferase [Tamlana fucoidanivorans]|uniref:GNAT family N-acetyltransferase n=1 Tax=Allotamlana fucoidanivorans TaxID=2583814 RepID=A0A5C4SF90_9FLAO|nr:GNAT family N-acetyltransferase [Tamlana fucoidanivorans]TNJ42148.1 GNAT family N-acetyltransferase [Tamlana fucoidanivorans]